MQKRVFYSLLLLVAIFCLGPLLYLLAFTDVSIYRQIFSNSNTWNAIANTFKVSLSVATLSVLLGVPLAWVLTRTDLPGRSRWRFLFSFAYAVPPYVGAIGWIILANPSSGLLAHLISSVNIYSFWGLVFVEASFLFSLVLLSCMGFLDRTDSSLEEAALLSGASPFQVFKDITLPMMKGPIASGFFLSFLATAASFGVPALIGGPARIYLLTTQIYSFQRSGTELGLKTASAISSLLMVIAALSILVSYFFSRGKEAVSVTGKATRPSQLSLGSWRWPVMIALVVFFVVILVLPILAILLSALSETQGAWNLANLGLSNFKRVIFETDETLRAIGHSLFLGGVTAAICLLISFFLGYFYTKSNLPLKKAPWLFASIPFSTPGSVVALAVLISFANGFWGIGPSMYNTLILFFIAYAIKNLSVSLKSIFEAYQQVHISLDESARVCGASWWQVMRTIYFPLLWPASLAALLLVFMPVFSELTMSILLTGPGLETVGTLIYQLQEYADVGGGGASVMSVMIVVVVIFLQSALRILQKRKGIGVYAKT